MQNKNYTQRKPKTTDNNHTEPSNKNRGHIVILTPKDYVKALRTYVAYMAYKHISKVVNFEEHPSNTKG